MARLKRRAEFKAVAKGMRVRRQAFTLQAIRRGEPVPGLAAMPRVGFTVTKKVGNAVERNRIKRRLRALCDARAGDFSPRTDYVIVARREALGEPFEALSDALGSALAAAAARLTRPAEENRP